MALPSTGVFEMRTTGSDLNGGAYVFGGSGTDRSQQANPHVTFDGSTITASNGGAGATITLSGYTVVAGDVDNYLRIASGTNFTAGLYRISSVNVGANTWTTDRNCTSGAGSGMVGRMGGAILTFSRAETDMVAGNKCWIKTGVYVETAGVTFDVGGTEASGLFITYEGYSVTRGDLGFVDGVDERPIWRLSGNNITQATVNTESIVFDSIIWDGDLQTGSRGYRHINTSGIARRCKFMDYTNTACCLDTTRTWLLGCEITGCTTQPAILTGGGCIFGNHIHDNAVVGVNINASAVSWILNNWIVKNTGATSDGIGNTATPLYSLIAGNVIANNGRDGYRGTTPRGMAFLNNVFYGNAVNLNQTRWLSGGADSYALIDHNAFGAAGTSHLAGGMAVGGNNITLTGDPFVSLATGDYRIDTSLGNGLLLAGSGFPPLVPGTAFDPNIDLGFAQATAGAGAGGGGGANGRISRIRRL